MYVFEPAVKDGELAEERFHEEEWDKEEYERIFRFIPTHKLIYSKSELTDGTV